ncbi:MAG: alkaline phosphatase family protein [Granulosicoccus sp.]|nr:alkaline phosphatase family protein [Granulosicoccus sp.]
MQKTLVILVVGLSPSMVGKHTPHLNALRRRGGLRPMRTVTPAVTCSVQATLMTGLRPCDHGIVANGWYFRDQAQVWLWRQANQLISGKKIWDVARERNANFTCAKMFWWYNMYSTADWSATPRPVYRADGRKIPDHYTHPADLHDELEAELGEFPLFKFWGPMADISSSRWISDATCHVMRTREPTLTLSYLPHLDYNLQRLGPDLNHPMIQQDLSQVDSLCGELIDVADAQGQRIVVVSEYGITPVSDAVHINRCLREAGMLRVRNEKGQEQLDPGASDAFAVADHQIAHIYVNRPENLQRAKAIVESLDGVQMVLDEHSKNAAGLNHPRSGELVAVSDANRWFSYYYWLDNSMAPDYSRAVDIHRKPGYDPVELFLDPGIKLPKLSVGGRLMLKKLGFRTLMNVISNQDSALVRGSHGRPTDNPEHGPLVMSSEAALLPDKELDSTQFKSLVLDHIFGPICKAEEVSAVASQPAA